MELSKYLLLIAISIFMLQSPVDESVSDCKILDIQNTPYLWTDLVKKGPIIVVLATHNEACYGFNQISSDCIFKLNKPQEELIDFLKQNCTDGQNFACYYPNIKQNKLTVEQWINKHPIPEQILMVIEGRVVKCLLNMQYWNKPKHSQNKYDASWEELLTDCNISIEPKINPNLISYFVTDSSRFRLFKIASRAASLEKSINNQEPFEMKIVIIDKNTFKRGKHSKSSRFIIIKDQATLVEVYNRSKRTGSWIVVILDSKKHLAIKAILTTEGNQWAIKVGTPQDLQESCFQEELSRPSVFIQNPYNYFQCTINPEFSYDPQVVAYLAAAYAAACAQASTKSLQKVYEGLGYFN